MKQLVNFALIIVFAVLDPDLEMGEGGGGGRVVTKKIFLALWASVSSKTKGGGSPRPLPWICHCFVSS